MTVTDTSPSRRAGLFLTLVACLLVTLPPAAAGLRVHWPLDETAGTTTADASGNGFGGVWQGTAGPPAWTAAGIDGGAVSFAGSDRESFIAEAFTGVAGTPCTVSLWIRSTSTSNCGLGFLGNGASGSQYYVLRMQSGAARANARNTTEVQATGTTAVNDGQWHHLAAVFASATDRRIYVDGALQATSSTNVPALPVNRFGIGALTRNTPYNPADLYPGLIDDAAVWDRALTPVEVSTLRGLILLGAGNASHLDPLLAAFAAQGTTQIRGQTWGYTEGLSGAPGTVSGTLAGGEAAIVLETGGRGMRLVAQGDPVIAFFTADRNAVQPGMPVTLSWRLFGADAATLSGTGAVSATEGTVTVSPTATTTYTLEATNSQGSVSQALTVSVATGLEEPVISEFVALNSAGLTDEDGSLEDWVEISNPTAFPIALSGFALTDDAALPGQWPFPAMELAPGQRLVVFASGKNRVLPGTPLHASFKLDAAGEYLALTRVSGDGGPPVVIHEFNPFPSQRADVSYGLAEDGTTGYLGTPTPGEPNGAVSHTGLVTGKVTFGTAGGLFFGGSVSLTLSHGDPAATIRYTTDGTPPVATSPAFSGPLSLTSTTLLKAAAFRDGHLPGPAAQEAYLFADPSLAAFSSNLPVLVIDTFGTTLPREDPSFKDAAFVAFDPATDTGRTSLAAPASENGASGIQVRGESSQLAGFNKLNFSFETRNAEGEDKDVPLFGFPAHSDWALHASEIDRTFIRDRLPHLLFNEIGRYSSRTRPVEVYLNQGTGPVTAADYRGVYLVLERVKRSKERVDIARLGPLENAAPQVTGGYIFKRDKSDPGEVTVSTASSGSFAITDPAEDRITTAQTAYLQTYLRSFESALNGPVFTDPANGYSQFIDVPSWIDFHVVQEFTKEVDSFVFSTWYHKDRGGRIACGPLWDFDRSFGNTNAADEASPQGWRGGTIGARGPFWARLFQDPDFLQRYIDRWQQLMDTTLSAGHLDATIDAMAAEVTEAQARNFQPAGPWPLANVTRSHLTFPTYAQHVTYLKTWVRDRLTWVKAQFTSRPQFDRAGGAFAAPFALTVTAPAGSIYYTTDGTDPRAPGGGIAGNLYAGPVPVGTTTTVTARALVGASWSGPVVGTFLFGEPASAQSLVVSEIMYHPAAPVAAEIAAGFPDAEMFEYVEMLNIAPSPIELTGVVVSGAFAFDFTGAAITILPPGGRLLLVRNPAAFAARHGPGLPIAGTYGAPSGADGGPKLDNGGERFVITAADQSVIRDFSYDDTAPWPTAPDGSGASLTLVDPTSNPDHGDPQNWRSSSGNGSPGTSATSPFTGDPGADDDANGLTNLLQYALGSPALEVRPSPADGALTIRVPVRLTTEGVSTELEFSSDLTTWTSNPSPEYLGEELIDASTAVRIYRTSAAGTHRFVRLRVSLAP